MSLLSRLAVQAARAYGILSARSNNISANFLVVAGGGGGGGAVNASPYYYVGSNGSNSSISGTGLTTLTSTGGGGGGTYLLNALSGGSGGGGGASSSNAGSGTANQGYAGGAGKLATDYTGGGGGGAGSVGADATGSGGTLKAGNGGSGVASSISGSSVTYAGGGGGAGSNTGGQGTGGSGGGGNGAKGSVGSSGTANTGGGGGGGDFGSGAGQGGGGAGGFRTSAGTSGGGASAESTISLSTLNTYSIVVGAGGNGGGTGASGTGGAGGSGIVIISYTSATPKFVGGTLTTSGGNQIHTFTSSGTLSPLTPVTANFLVVAGGGGGGSNNGGGAGAGGLQTGSTTLYSGATYLVTVGAGGSGAGSGSAASGSQGSNSVLSGTGLTTLTSVGGGYGAGGSSNTVVVGGNGGSGGGGRTNSSSGGTGTSGQGNNGGTGGPFSGSYAAGGGGGAGAAGANASSSVAGDGGVGVASSISGTSTYYAGGGGGGLQTSGTIGAGGNGGGGSGSITSNAVSGTPNTGGGGGGGGYDGTIRGGGSGGSGIVIISYAGSQVFNGGLVTSSGGNTIHTFNATGALTPLTNNLTNSLRFRRSNNAYLSRTPTVVGNQKTWTYSAWVKRGLLGSIQDIWHANGPSTTENDYFAFDSDTLQFRIKNSNSVVCELITTQVFRDPSAWYHIVAVWDSTQATAANRVKLYVNGNQITAFSTATYPSQNTNTNSYNSTVLHTIGTQWYNSTLSNYLDGYMTDINFIDGQALEPYYFGNNDANGVWKPIKYTGMYGTNGFYLTFADTSALTTSSNVGLGKDTSGNGNYWTTNNISITAGTTYDAMLDVPTNTSATVANYATLNPLQVASATLSNANLSMVRSATGYGETSSTFSPEGNKGYFEITRSSTGDHLAGFILNSISPSTNNYTASGSYWYQCDTGNVRYGTGGSTATLITGCTSAPTGSQIIMVAFDFTGGNRNVWFGLQGTWGVNASSQTGVPSTGAFPHLTTTQLTDICRLYFSNGDTNAFSINFGQRPFTYTPPTGFVRLNTFNLPTPTILQGNKYMDATLYTGNGSTQTIVNAGQFKPDFVWIKRRDGAGQDHVLQDSNRGFGATTKLASSSTAAENTTGGATGSEWGYVTAANSNGFNITASTNGDQANKNTWTYAGWQWQAGQGSTSSNTSGSITSTVSVNATAGFSVVTYTGNGATGATVGHGLGVAPKMVIVKQRSSTEAWVVGHQNLTGWNYILNLNSTAAQFIPSTQCLGTPTSTNIVVGPNASTNSNTATYVAYCWAEIAGFSKFGSYTGNGSADGTFVYTGFRPKFILWKRTTLESWIIIDTSRSPFNVADKILYPFSSAAEITSNRIDIVSNGFKIRTTDADTNGSGATYIYMAFAENPFKNSNAR